VMTKFLMLGMPLADVIHASTLGAAETIGWQDTIGTVLGGKGCCEWHALVAAAAAAAAAASAGATARRGHRCKARREIVLPSQVHWGSVAQRTLQSSHSLPSTVCWRMCMGSSATARTGPHYLYCIALWHTLSYHALTRLFCLSVFGAGSAWSARRFGRVASAASPPSKPSFRTRNLPRGSDAGAQFI
jgi:hypothetical protein